MKADRAQLKIPPPAEAAFRDGLWRHTCCELFLKRAGDDGYLELNFSPSSEWAAYSFTGYRAGMQPCAIPRPAISVRSCHDALLLAASFELDSKDHFGDEPIIAAVAAVIEAQDGSLSYWALAHPGAKPDFHHPDGFVLQA